MAGGDGRYGSLTSQAVMAFQKVEGLERDGIAGPVTRVRLAAAQRPAPIGIADGVEIDLARQVLFVVQGGQVVEIHNTSTGRAGWSTPPGQFAVNREIDGMRRAPLGNLWRPKYFNGGIAVHGSGSIPAEPASHGCARVSMAAMDHLWDSGRLTMGSPVVVY
jgi:lipoprotein-anchoring transpeptidase ErfK/SrfK